jgi:hypothetical protein
MDERVGNREKHAMCERRKSVYAYHASVALKLYLVCGYYLLVVYVFI